MRTYLLLRRRGQLETSRPIVAHGINVVASLLGGPCDDFEPYIGPPNPATSFSSGAKDERARQTLQVMQMVSSEHAMHMCCAKGCNFMLFSTCIG